jgi:uncharacterized DUF497 family protein
VADSFVYVFEWDPQKAAENATKHEVGFELAATVFRDPLHVAVYDDDHSEAEERWVTLGQAENGKLLVVVHTFEEAAGNSAKVRIISAREATTRERRDYEGGPEAREPMRGEYDFSKGVRGKFLRAGVTLLIPVYLEPEVQALVAECAAKAGTGVNDLVNQVLLRGLVGPPQPTGKPSRSAATKTRSASRKTRRRPER